MIVTPRSPKESLAKNFSVGMRVRLPLYLMGNVPLVILEIHDLGGEPEAVVQMDDGVRLTFRLKELEPYESSSEVRP